MSKCHKEPIICPHCQAQGEFDIWESVNVDLDPELREKIFNDELFLYHCPSCGEVTGIPYGTVYHDMENKFMLLFDFFKPDDFDYAPKDIDAPESMKNGRYKFRIVFDRQRLKEKILIFEAGLSDVAIERQKHMLTHVANPDVLKNNGKIYFEKVEGPDDKHEHGQITFLCVFDDSDKMLAVTMPMETYYQNELSCKLDPRLQVEGCVCVDEEWISKQMKEG